MSGRYGSKFYQIEDDILLRATAASGGGFMLYGTTTALQFLPVADVDKLKACALARPVARAPDGRSSTH